MYKILICDLETQNHPWYGNVASPHCPDNYIVAPGWRLDTVHDDGTVSFGEVRDRYFASAAEADAGASWFDVIDEASIIVCHNAQFEVKWFLSKHRQKFEDFIRRGGRVLDTALAEYLLSHQQEMYPALDEVAPRYGGTHKIDGVKILWQQGRLTSEIDKDLLLEYLSGPSGDIDNTARVYYGQLPKLIEQGMWRCYLERCDAQVAYAYCEWFGLFVNQEVAYKNYEIQTAKINELQSQLEALLPELPEGCEFSWSSRYHMSAFVYGGPVKYRHKVQYDPPQFEKDDFYGFADGSRYAVTAYDHSTPEWRAELDAQRGPRDVFKSGKNKGAVKVYREDTDVPKLKWEDTSFELPGLIKFDELPANTREKYTGVRAEFKGAQTLCDGSPVYATSEEALEGLKVWAPSVALMVELATLRKDTGTYYLSEKKDDDGNVIERKGMLAFVCPDSIVHHSLNSTATVTTRLSSARPNLQNLPRADEDGDGVAKSNVKEGFTSRFGSDGRIIEVDYSALEVVMLCAITGDTDLLKLLQDGIDMHCYRLAFRLGMEYDEVKAIVKDESHPRHNELKVMRTDIKPISFADQYGATAEGIAFNTGCSVEDARLFQENEMKMFPISRGYRQVIADEVERTGSEPTAIHREQDPITGAWRVYRRGYFQAPSGTCYSFRQHEAFDKESRQRVMQYKATQMANYPYQGEAGYMMAVSMGRIMRHMVAKNWYDGQVCLINNVHDAAYADAANEVVGREAALAIQAIMADAPRYLSEIHEAYNIAHIPFPAAAEMGADMQNKHHVH